jgi:hypothetical protein
LTCFADRDAPALTPKPLIRMGDLLTRLSLASPFVAIPQSSRSEMRLTIHAAQGSSPRALSFDEASASDEAIPPGSSVLLATQDLAALPR